MTPMQSTAKNRCSKRAELHRHALNPMSAFGRKADIRNASPHMFTLSKRLVLPHCCLTRQPDKACFQLRRSEVHPWRMSAEC